MRRGDQGVTLIELLLAIVLVVTVVIALSLSLSRISGSAISSKQRWIAGSLASTQVKELMSQPYAYLDATLPGNFDASNSQCDCNIDDFANVLSTASSTTGTTFYLKSCVNFVTAAGGNSWPPQCPGSDTGFKNIVVQVSWINKANTYTVTQKALMTHN